MFWIFWPSAKTEISFKLKCQKYGLRTGVPENASFRTIPTMILFGSWPEKSFSCVTSMRSAATVITLQTTRLTGYFAVGAFFSKNFRPCAKTMAGLTLTFRTNRTMSSIMILFSSASMSANASRLLMNLSLTFTWLMRYLSWKKRSAWMRPIMSSCWLSRMNVPLLMNPEFAPAPCKSATSNFCGSSL